MSKNGQGIFPGFASQPKTPPQTTNQKCLEFNKLRHPYRQYDRQFLPGKPQSTFVDASLRNLLPTSYGFAEKCRERVVTAICSLSDEFISWPSVEEKKEISNFVYEQSFLTKCVGIIDGTLFPLRFEPQTPDSPDYHGRKFQWSLSVLIVNDHKRRIRYYLAGFPGCCHDNRVWTASNLYKQPEKYFSGMEYLLGDSAFSNGRTMVAAFKKPVGHPMPQPHEEFNTLLAKARIISEHTIGILKGRFPWLRSIRMIVTPEKESMKKILTHIHATIVLHNWLIDLNDDLDERPEDDDDVPHPNDIFDPQIGQEDVLPGDFDTRVLLLHMLQHRCLIST